MAVASPLSVLNRPTFKKRKLAFLLLQHDSCLTHMGCLQNSKCNFRHFFYCVSDAQAHRFREKSVSSVYWPLSYEGSRPTPILGSQASFTGCPIELLATGRASRSFFKVSRNRASRKREKALLQYYYFVAQQWTNLWRNTSDL